MHGGGTKDILHAAVVSFRPVWGVVAANLSRIIETLELASGMGVQLAVFPEMCLSGISASPAGTQRGEQMQMRAAQAVPGPATDAVSEVTCRLGIYAVFGMPLREGDAVYNAAVVCGPQGFVGAYRKIHPYDEERLWANEGCEPFVFHTPWGPVGLSICYDTYHFPELLRYCAALGCRAVLNPTAACNRYRRGDDNGYEIFLKNAVIANGVYVLSANLCGREQLQGGGGNIGRDGTGPEYGGGSVIIGPSASADNMYRTRVYAGDFSQSECGLYSAVIDLSLAARGIFSPNPLCGRADFRPALYAEWYSRLAKEREQP